MVISDHAAPNRQEGEIQMPQFVIERDMPGVGKLGQDDLTRCNKRRRLMWSSPPTP
jgi:hypothetical protein